MATAAADDYLLNPFTVLIDSAEQLPYGFRGLLHDPESPPEGYPDDLGPYTFADLHGDAREHRRPLIIPIRTVSLTWGDYSLENFQNRFAIERKSFQDLFGTLGHGRERFLREMEALATYDFASVVVEATWPEVFVNPPSHSRMDPLAVGRTILAWSQRYPSVHWVLAGPRELAERLTFRIIERFWRELSK